jgi:hypothetical protein
MKNFQAEFRLKTSVHSREIYYNSRNTSPEWTVEDLCQTVFGIASVVICVRQLKLSFKDMIL